MFLDTTLIDPITKLIGASWLEDISIGSIIIRLVLALIIGGLLGVERAKKHQAAGFRTYILVCIGATVAMVTNQFIIQKAGGGDAARLGAQVISGIGFLGAGTILITSRNQIKGLTTAAGLWACACLGLAVGVGFYTLALIACVLVIIVLSILPKIEAALTQKSRSFEIHIELKSRENLKDFITLARNNGMKIYAVEHNSAYSASGLSVYTISMCNTNKERRLHEEYVKEYSELPYVNYVEIMK